MVAMRISPTAFASWTVPCNIASARARMQWLRVEVVCARDALRPWFSRASSAVVTTTHGGQRSLDRRASVDLVEAAQFLPQESPGCRWRPILMGAFDLPRRGIA